MVEYFCPFCTEYSCKGPIGWKQVGVHVGKAHPDKVGDYEKMDKDEHAIFKGKTPVKLAEKKPEEPQPVHKVETSDKEIEEMLKETQPVAQQQTQQPQQQSQQQQTQQQFDQFQMPPQEQSVVLPPYEETPEPKEWIRQFLANYGMKQQFILFQVQKVNMTGMLPYGIDLEADMRDMDSGVKNPRTVAYIKWFYDQQVAQYLQRRTGSQALPQYMQSQQTIQPYQQGMQQGIPVGNPQQGMGNPQQLAVNQRGIPVSQPIMQNPINPNPNYPYYPYNPYPVYPPQPAQNQNNNFMMTLLQQQMQQAQQAQQSWQEEVRRKDEQDRRRLEQEIHDLKTAPAVDPAMEKLNTKIDMLETENKQRFLRELEEIKIKATSSPGPEQLATWINNAIEKERTRVTATDLKTELENKFRQMLNLTQGTSQAEVDMKRADNELQLGLSKINAENKKGEIYGKALTEAASLLGEGIGRGLTGKSIAGGTPSQGAPTQAQQETPSQMPEMEKVICPGCKAEIQIPPGITSGQCPKCRTPITIGSEPPKSVMSEIPTETKPTETKPQTETVPETSEIPLDVIGHCTTCQKAITVDNLGIQDGRAIYCKECYEKQSKSKKPSGSK